MIHNFKKDFKPYLDNLRTDNKVLKDHFLNDVFIKQVREQAREKIEKAINPKTGLIKWSLLPNLLSNNPKLIKNEKIDCLTNGLMLAPTHWSEYNTCSNASFGCGINCLMVSGHGEKHMVSNGVHHVHVARMIRTLLFFEYREQFLNKLFNEIANFEKKAKRLNKVCGIRLNTMSDIKWEKIKVKDNKTFFELFPNVSFYDYTKDVNRDITHIPNYHLTFSLNEKNSLLIGLAFKKGMNVTVVVRNKKQGREWLPKPKTYSIHGLTKDVVDGDEHDYRPIDGKNKFVLLNPKGKDTPKDQTGFVKELN